ncbi:acyl-CoA dehydrogenase [Candidatus Mycobacterium wuenschmannii]|uniref:Acyl-CoA dehydrogenase n=1 Tax=Candidatus Mycobacterium wuenschmannii TaxID=3027808 RepID=A0ABY8VV13_9MYCO|nr:acyl-CoA dehydrogenase [Candidatus Mycobacterium wuenschmannii]WIM86781.1 acyl-CoA dehydrogenase [Candidatus Mycobacterium wuenschmannii]
MSIDYRLGLGLTADHIDLSTSVAKFADRWLTADLRRGAVESDEVRPQYWAALAEQGVLGLHVDENHGGQGAGLLELAVALEALGRTCAPGPLVSTVLCSAALTADDGKAATALLPQLVDGTHCGAVGFADGLTGSVDATGAVTVNGKTPVLGAGLADVIVVPVHVDGQRRYVAMDSTELTVSTTTAVDVTRATPTVTATDVTVPDDRLLADVDAARIADIAAIVLGAEAVGLASWCVSTASEYAQLRVQFGRPIGQFQGVKHRCASAAVGLEQARAAVWDAARAYDAGDDTAGFAAAVARLVAPDAAVAAARDCMQVLGGIGYTWEHDAHLYYRRAITVRALLGRSRDAAAAVADAALAGARRPFDYELPDVAEQYRDSVRSELAELVGLEEDEQLARLGDGGWVMPFLAPPFGRGAGPVEQVVIAEELERAGLVTPELGLATWLMPSVAVHGTEEQHRDLLAPTLRGDVFWCQMFSEPEAGSDLAALRTEAVKVDGGWVVNGQKIWTSLGFAAEWGVLLARTNPTAPKHRGITYFVVDMTTQGITVNPLREASGGSLFSEIFFDDVFVPDSGVVGAVDDGWQVARGTLGNERVALGKGLPINANIDDLLDFANKREVPAATLGELVAENHTIATMNGRTLLAQLRGVDPGAAPNISKYLSMRFGQRIADFCHAELGAAGVYEEADQLSCNWIEKTVSSRAMTVYGGTSEIQLNVIGERVLGLPREPEPAA